VQAGERTSLSSCSSPSAVRFSPSSSTWSWARARAPGSTKPADLGRRRRRKRFKGGPRYESSSSGRGAPRQPLLSNDPAAASRFLMVNVAEMDDAPHGEQTFPPPAPIPPARLAQWRRRQVRDRRRPVGPGSQMAALRASRRPWFARTPRPRARASDALHQRAGRRGSPELHGATRRNWPLAALASAARFVAVRSCFAACRRCPPPSSGLEAVQGSTRRPTWQDFAAVVCVNRSRRNPRAAVDRHRSRTIDGSGVDAAGFASAITGAKATWRVAQALGRTRRPLFGPPR